MKGKAVAVESLYQVVPDHVGFFCLFIFDLFFF